MEIVSETFKNAIKSSDREIKGYVEIIYNEQDASNYVLINSPTKLMNSLDNEIVDGKRKVKKYASLEEKYTSLDGSFIIPNYNIIGDSIGYVSSNVFDMIENPNITLYTETNYKTCSGVTIYFENNIAKEFILTIIDDNDESISIEVIDNFSSIYQKIFDSNIVIKSLSIDIKKMEYPNRRIRIAEIDLGISQVYEGRDLVSFTTNEEIDLLVTSTPINDCVVNLNNYDNSFDPLNPVGLVKYLNDNCTIKPYIGVLTEENGIEYVSMGYFYLKNWNSNVDGNVTLNGQSLMSKLLNLPLISDGRLLKNAWKANTLSDFLTNTYGYKFNLLLGTSYNYQLKKTNFIDFFHPNLLFQASIVGIFFVSRQNEIILKRINNNVVDVLSRRSLMEDVKYEANNTLNNMIIKNYTSNWSTTSNTKEDVINTTHVLTKNEEYVWYNFSKYFGRYSEGIFTYTNDGHGTAELIDISFFMAYVKLSGNIGDKITIHLVGYVFPNPPTQELLFTNNNKTGYSLNVDFTNNFYISNQQAQSFFENITKKEKKYKVMGKHIGDPSLTPGDKISVETKFGYKDVIMTKYSLTFDGGLNGSFEGVGD